MIGDHVDSMFDPLTLTRTEIVRDNDGAHKHHDGDDNNHFDQGKSPARSEMSLFHMIEQVVWLSNTV